MKRAASVLATLLLLAAPRLEAQQQTIEDFVRQVGWLWEMGDVASLVDLLPAGERVALDAGAGIEHVNPRHAAAALRALFESRETAAVETVRVTLAGGGPRRGFGELAWTFRSRGGPAQQTRTLYVGAVLQGPAWRISEIRVMP